ncbi:hypothetical protein D3C79_712980 [compost metagenome]
MVFPARVADRHNGVGRHLLEEVGTDLQCTGAADGLGGDHTASGQQWRLGTEQQPLHGLVVGGDAVDRQVTAGSVLGSALGFGFDHCAQQWDTPFFVAVNTYTQVDLVATGIGVESFVEAQNGVAWCQLDSGKQAHYYLGSEWRVEEVARSSRLH